ncbi:hypothetical protein ACF0H5_003614 [Mactra antiquata]
MADTVFEQFISENLIKSNLISGSLLLSKQGHVMYKYGDLKNLSQENIAQLLGLFDRVSDTESYADKDVNLSSSKGRKIKYKVYHKTFSSMYATSSEGNGGLTVCNLPYGVLVCTYDSHTRVGEAVKAIEYFCDIMRR